MKKVFYIIFGLVCFMGGILFVDAASFSLKASTSSVKPNGSFTVSVGGDCIGRVNLSVTNGTISESSVWVEQNTQTITVTAGSSGSVVVTATPQTGFSDSDANIYNPGSRTINVSINNNSQTVSAGEKKSSNNKLKSLSIEGYQLIPEFDDNTLEYKVYLPSDITNIKVDGIVNDAKAKVDGFGSITLKSGNNDVTITVTSESGSKRVYRINAYVEEKPEVYLDYLKEKIGVMKNYDNVLVPDGFSLKEVKINDNLVKVLSNEEIMLVYGINTNNERGYYIIDEKDKVCESRVIPIKIFDKVYFVKDIKEEKEGYKITKIKINDEEIPVYQNVKNDNYYLVGLLNNMGKNVDYFYESNDASWQLYPGFLNNCEIPHKSNLLTYVLGSLLGVFVILSGYLFWKLKSGKHEKN